jgi:hypothetical protein
VHTATSERAVADSAERQALLTLEASGEVARFLASADRWLALRPDDAEVCLLLMQRLVEQGLLYRAARVADNLPAELRSDAGVAQLISQLDTPRNNGLASWQRFAEQFDANMTALRARYAWADEVAAAWRAESNHLELHCTRHGLWQVYDRRPGEAGGWRPCFGDQGNAKLAEQIAAQVKGRIVTPLVVEGVGLGELLPALREVTRDTFLGSCPIIYLAEPYLVAVAAALHLCDWRVVIADPRVKLFVGGRAHDDLAAAVEAQSWTMPPNTILQPPPWLPEQAGRARPRLAEAVERRAARLETLRASAAVSYQGRDRAYWHGRFVEALAGKGPCLRVLGIASRFTTVLQYSMRDALRACAALGCQTRLLIEPDNHSCLTPEKKLEAVAEFRPDLIFTIDHTRARQRDGLVDGVPFLTWVQDRLPWLFDRATGQAMGPLDFCMGFGRDELVEQCGYPAGRFYACEMATNPAALRSDGEAPSNAAAGEGRLACDVAYATHAAQTPAAFHAEVRARCGDEHGRRLMDAILEELVALAGRAELNGGLHLGTFLERMERATGIQVSGDRRSAFLAEYLRPLLDRLLRHQTVAWAAAWTEQSGRRFHIYGNGWESHPQFGKFARGTLRHGPELGAAFRAAKINLHAGCNPALHQRVLDGLSAGGFFLVRRHAADVTHRVTLAVYEIVRRRGTVLPTMVAGGELPAELREECRAILRMSGLDPDAPFRVADEDVRFARRVLESPEPMLASQVWPDFERVTFGTQEEFARKLDWFLAHADERQVIAAEMRERALAHFSYEVRMKSVLAWMRGQLAG